MSKKRLIYTTIFTQKQARLLFAFFFLLSFNATAQTEPYYTQHKNWEEIHVNWTNLDQEIGKKFLPFRSTGLHPAPTRDYPLTYSGRAVSHAFSPNGTFYVGFSTGGLWQMVTYPGEDSISWKLVSTNELLSESIGAVTVNPNNENNIILATGSFENGAGRGIYYTEDGGTTWNLSSTPNDQRPNMCYAFSWYNNKLYLANQNGLYVSTNNGKSWQQEQIAGSYENVTDIVNFNSGTALYAAISYRGVYKKIGNGSWAKVANSASNYQIDLECSNDKIYAMGNDWGRATSTLDTSNNNSGFGSLNASTQGTFNTLKVSADNSAIYVGNGGDYIFKSTDGGKQFNSLINEYGQIHIDQRGFAMDPVHEDTIYAICDGGVYRSGDAGSTWYNLNIGLQTFQLTSMDNYPKNLERTYSGTQDNGSQSCVDGLWTIGGAGDGGATHYALDDSSVAYEIRSAVRATKLNEIGLGVGGYTEFFAQKKDGSTLWLNALAVNRKNTDVQYLSTIDGLYKTNNAGAGATWPNNNPGWSLVVNQDKSVYRWYVNFVDVGILDTARVYFLNYEKIAEHTYQFNVYKSSNSGKTWTEPETIPGHGLHSIVATPNKIGRSFVVGGDNNGAIVRLSDNFEDKYTQVPGELPPMQVFHLAETPKQETGIIQRYIGNEMGVYWSFGQEGKWFKLNNNLPNVQVRQVQYHELSGNIRIATYGRGLWEFPCPVFTTSALNLSSLNSGIYGSTEKITVESSAAVNNTEDVITLISEEGVSFSPGFSIVSGAELSVYTFKEIE